MIPLLNWLRPGRQKKEIALSDWVTRSVGQIHQELDGRVIILSVKGGDYREFNDVGSAIWLMLEQESEVGALCDAIAQRCSLPLAIAQLDVRIFLDQLLEQELIVIRPANP